jgi:hypothetical protein
MEGSWLPEPEDRARLVDMEARLKPVRTATIAILALALVAAAPWEGGWTLIPRPIASVLFAIAVRGVARAARPELWIGTAWLISQLMIAVPGSRRGLRGDDEGHRDEAPRRRITPLLFTRCQRADLRSARRTTPSSRSSGSVSTAVVRSPVPKATKELVGAVSDRVVEGPGSMACEAVPPSRESPSLRSRPSTTPSAPLTKAKP